MEKKYTLTKKTIPEYKCLRWNFVSKVQYLQSFYPYFERANVHHPTPVCHRPVYHNGKNMNINTPILSFPNTPALMYFVLSCYRINLQFPERHSEHAWKSDDTKNIL